MAWSAVQWSDGPASIEWPGGDNTDTEWQCWHRDHMATVRPHSSGRQHTTKREDNNSRDISAMMNLFDSGSVYNIPFKDDHSEGVADTTSDSDSALNLAQAKIG